MNMHVLPADVRTYLHSSNPPVVETVRFHLKKGVSDEVFLAEAEIASHYVSQFPGFLGRRLSKQGDGTWLDHVHWACQEDAKAASENFMAEPRLQNFLNAIESSSVEFNYATLVHFAA